MKYYSTGKQSPAVDFKEATINGQAPDKGLYFPEQLPLIDDSLIRDIESLSNEEIAFQVIRPFVGNSIPEQQLRQIVAGTINFDIPLVPVTDSISALELFHGPTLAFKDIGARFMSRCLGYFVRDFKQKVTVLVATSGDTGGAVASGFYDVEGIDVIILYPSGKVSEVQEKQLTTNGKNIHAIEVAGSFDDCQAMVKEAFVDNQLREKRFLTSANSINVARWLPQQFYYFFAYKQWPDKANPPVISVPSGNFGNICAGLLAQHGGLPVSHFIAACNVNDVVPRFMQTREFEPRPSVSTLSNAMDVGHPSNFIRILEMFRHYIPELSKSLSAVSISDEDTTATIREVYRAHGYILDPHGAVGYRALADYLSVHGEQKGVFLETAHPVKFPEAVEQHTGVPIKLPAAVTALKGRQKSSIQMQPRYDMLREYLAG